MKLIFSFFLLGMVTTSAYSQKTLKPKSAEEVVDALCHTWIATNLEMGSMRLPLPLKIDFRQLTLKNDGTFVRITAGEEISGKWTYRPKLMLLILEDKFGTVPYMLTYISGSELKYKIDQREPVEYIVLKKEE